VPPQSTSVSVPFFTRSVQPTVEHFFVVVSQTPLVQSPATAHPEALAHLFGHVPPQSTSVSEPFFTRSVQDGAAQTFALQEAVEQSAAAAQPLPIPQAAGHEPPQSTSVSEPFFTPSPQVTGGVVAVGAGVRPASPSPGTMAASLLQAEIHGPLAHATSKIAPTIPVDALFDIFIEWPSSTPTRRRSCRRARPSESANGYVCARDIRRSDSPEVDIWIHREFANVIFGRNQDDIYQVGSTAAARRP
jgi:hypothetical protein